MSTTETTPVTAEMLVARFGTEGTRTEPDGTVLTRGHCGYVGGRADSMIVGFDDGYDFMGYLEARGWRAMASKGDWPYVVYLYREEGGERCAIVEYCEGDFTCWQFPDHVTRDKVYADLRAQT